MFESLFICSFSQLFAVCHLLFIFNICIVHKYIVTLRSKTFTLNTFFGNIGSKRNGVDTQIPTIFYSFKRYQIKVISFVLVPFKFKQQIHLQRSFHLILNFLLFAEYGKSNLIVVWYLIKSKFCVHLKQQFHYTRIWFMFRLFWLTPPQSLSWITM